MLEHFVDDPCLLFRGPSRKRIVLRQRRCCQRTERDFGADSSSLEFQNASSAIRVAFAIRVSVMFLAGSSGKVDPSAKYRFSTS